MSACVFRHAPKMLGPGQRLQHVNGGDDVVVDDLALLGGKRAARNAEVLDLVIGKEMGGIARLVQPLVAGDFSNVLLRLRRHEFPADIAFAQKLTVLVELAQARSVCLLQLVAALPFS